jgi:hypothetical protein
VLVVRDFLDPGPAPVWLDLPGDDGQESDDPAVASSAALLERFAREFRSLSASRGFALERVEGAPPVRAGWRRYRLSHKHAAEFVLRKDYRADWATEVQEEYTYYTQEQFEQLFARLGLRILASSPLWNPWIVRHRFQDRFQLRDAEGRAIDHPATNYIIVGEKVSASEGVRFRLAGAAERRGFLRLESHRERSSGRRFDLAYRPHPTVDIIPFFTSNETAYVLARTSYPRPILRAGREDNPALDSSGPADYVTEPLNVVQSEAPLGATVEDALARAAGMAPAAILRMLPGTTYYPSPGGLLEEVRSVLVEIEPTYVNTPLAGISGFASSGRVRAIEARQLLRAAQVGGLPDARLELNVHDLLMRLGIDRGPWISEEISVARAATAPATPLAVLLGRPGRRAFERAAPEDAPGFLELRATEFEELASDGLVVSRAALEYVQPRLLGANTIATALLARDAAGRPLLGLDEDDLPAAQSFTGVSNLPVTPAWRLPRPIATLPAAQRFVAERLHEEYGIRIGTWWQLGGPYRPSPGLTAEVVHPLAGDVLAIAAGKRALVWVPVDDLLAGHRDLRDGHLRITALRAAHGLGVAPLPSPPAAR